MSHSQFHCTARVHLDMHGLIFETSICYWQDQPGSRAPGRTARRRADASRRGRARRAPDPGGPRRPSPRGEGAATAAQLFFFFFFRGALRAPLPPEPDGTRARAGRAAAAAGADPPSAADRRRRAGDDGSRRRGGSDGRARGERDLEAGTSPRPGHPQTGGGALRSGRGTRPPKSAHTAAAAPTRRGDAPPRSPFHSPEAGTRRAALSLSCSPSRFPHRLPPPPACCSRPAPAGPRTDAGTSASRNAHGPLRLAGPLGRHTAGFGRKSPFVRRRERRPASERGTRPKRRRRRSRPERGSASPATGSEPERRPPVPEHRTPPRLPRDRGARKSRPAGGPLRRDPNGLIDRKKNSQQRRVRAGVREQRPREVLAPTRTSALARADPPGSLSDVPGERLGGRCVRVR